MPKEKKENKNSQRVQKCLNENYRQYKINVKKEKFAVWQKYADSRGISMRALMIEIMDKAVEEAGFVIESETVEE